MAIPVSILVARMRLKWLLIAAALCTAIITCLMVVIQSVTLILLLGILAGASFIIHHVVAAPFFMRNSLPKERIYLFGINYAVEILSSVIAVAVGGWLAREWTGTFGSELLGLRGALLVGSATVALAVIPYLSIHSPAPPRGEPGRLRLLRHRQPKLLAKLLVPGFLVGCGAGLIIPFLNLYFRDRFDQGPDAIGRIFSVSQALTAFGFLLGPVLARRFGMVRTVASAEILSIPFFLLLAFTTRLEVAILAFWMRGALMNMNHPVSRNFAMEAVDEDQQPLTNAAMETAWSLSWMISTQVGGWIIEHHGYSIPMFITVGLYFTASCLYFAFFHDFERRVLVPKRLAEEAARA
jgi:predicted MFS family arabinose efflux permease